MKLRELEISLQKYFFKKVSCILLLYMLPVFMGPKPVKRTNKRSKGGS